MKKTINVSTVGRRSKQQILKDFVRPQPASTISSSINTSGGGYGSGNIPGCAGSVPTNRTSCGDLSDHFGRETAIGWGGAGIEILWEYLCSSDPAHNDAGAHFVSCTTASVGANGGILIAQPYSSGRYAGGYVAAAIPYDDVADTNEVLFRLSWTDMGDLDDNTTQHSIAFCTRGPPNADPDNVLLQANSYGFGGCRIVWNQGAVHPPYKHILQISSVGNTIGIADDYIEEGAQYYLRVSSTVTGTSATFWRTTDEEGDGYFVTGPHMIATYPPAVGVMLAPNAQAHGSIPTAMRATVNVHAATVNPAAGTVCADDPPSGSGTFIDTLYRKQNYWRPQRTDVDYYRQIWFDGMAVQEGIHYTILDGYKIVPTDYTLSVDTLVEAEIVVE